MRVRWYNGGLLIEPEGPIEAEAMLVLLQNMRYELPQGYNEDGRHTPSKDASGSTERGGDLCL